MASSPYYKILVQKNQKDLTDFVVKFSYEDAVDVDNLVTLMMKDGTSDYLDDLDLKKGDNIIFQFGYINGKSSPKYTARMVDIINTYEKSVATKLIASDVGILLKKNESKKVWENTTIFNIVKSIAVANGLFAIIDVTTTIHEFLPQGGKTDYEFLKYLTTIESNGSFRFFLRGNELHFTKRNLRKKSIKTFTYNDANGDVLKFKPSDQETIKENSSRDTVVTSVDPFTGTVIEHIVNNTTSLDDVKLGDYNVHFNENGIEIATSKSAAIENANDPNRSGKQINIPVSNIIQGNNTANKIKKDSALKDVTATLKTIGDPDLLSDKIITMAGVAKKDAGNWYTNRVNHVISAGGGYITNGKLQKNAIKKSTTQDDTLQVGANNTVGLDAGDQKKETTTVVFNGDGVKIDERTSSF